MIGKVYSAQVVGLKVDVIEVEVDVGKGLHSFSIVGLPDKAVEEARDRISAAVKNSGFKSPQKGNRKVIVSLAPADLKKEGPIFDLAIALANLLATREIQFNPTGKAFLGELALTGELRPIKGALLIAKKLRESGFQEIYLPAANAAEAALIRGLEIYGAKQLKDIINHLSPRLSSPARLETAARETQAEKDAIVKLTPTPATKIAAPEIPAAAVDLADIKGQPTAKRGLEIAAAGGHNLAMSGPPGTGKTMLAKAFAGLLPPLNFEEVLEVTGIHSAAGLLGMESQTIWLTTPPFRAPHHTASYISLVGGGAWPRPGEITLAHRGVLFLDEFPEFDKKVIEALRQPLEDRLIHISRARGSMTFPASFILIAAMNPCPCGQKGLKNKECICSPGALFRYQRKISGPIIDRIDLWLEVPQIEHHKLSEAVRPEESTAATRERVAIARERAERRFAPIKKFRLNSEMGVKDLKQFAPLNDSLTKLLNESAKRLDLSARAYHRVIKIARTIADLAGHDQIAEAHLLEALQYRPKINY